MGGIEYDRYTITAFVERGQRRPLGHLTQVEREHGLRDTEARCLVSLQHDARGRRHTIVVAMHPY